LALEDVFKELDWEDMGVNINGRKLSHLRYANDVVLITDKQDELFTMLTQLAQKSEKIGLKMNMNKTKIMTNTNNKINIGINNENIEVVDHYIYLGQTVAASKENQTAEIQRRIRLAWAAFGKLRWVLKNTKIQQYLKTRVFDQCILPVLTYGSQTWTLTKANMDKIEKTQRKMERFMLGIKLQDRKSNEWIREKTKVKNVTEQVTELKWGFAGHNARREDGRWNTEIQNWRPWMGRRARGRPQMRLRDDCKSGRNTLEK
jgi:hypothetical protein